MTVAKTTEKLDVKLQASVLALGQVLYESRSPRHVGTRTQPMNPEALASVVGDLLRLVRASPSRRLLGLRQSHMGPEDAVRLKAVSFVAWQMVADTGVSTHIEEIAQALVDGNDNPCEQIILIRDCLGRLVCEGVLLMRRSEGARWTGGLLLPERTFSWMNGGMKSMADFAPRKMESDRLRKSLVRDDDGDEAAPRKRLPTAREIYDQVREQVIGLDPQVKVLASRIALHVARAEMLKNGAADTAVSGLVAVLIGSSGSGKSFLTSQIAKKSLLTVATIDSCGLTSEGYVGAGVDDIYRFLTNEAGGDAVEASRGIVMLDEFDKKSSRHGREVCTLSVQQELLSRLQCNAPFQVGGRRASESFRQFTFDGRPTAYFLAGVFAGLDEIISKKAGRRGIGFASEAGSRQHAFIQDSLKELGFLDELINRVSTVVRLPDPAIGHIMQATANGILDGYNQLLASKEIVLFPADAAIRAIGDYAMQTKTFYRGAKAVLATIVEEVFFDPHRGTVVVEAGDVRRAIDRLSSGIVQPDDDGKAGRPVEKTDGASADADLDAGAEPSEAVGG